MVASQRENTGERMSGMPAGMSPDTMKSLMNLVFSFLIPERRRVTPDGADTFTCRSKDFTELAGWVIHPHRRKACGTVFLFHGFSGNTSHIQWLTDRFSGQYGFVSVAADLRHHGLSGDAVPTFGEAESWDVMSVIDFAESQGLPKPYVLYGESLGGMASQLAAAKDKRVSGVIVNAAPGWAWDAIGKVADFRSADIKKGMEKAPGILSSIIPLFAYGLVPVANLINYAYKDDVLTKGDPRNLPSSPRHEPLFLYMMGDKDHYDINQTRKIFDHWYEDESAKAEVLPGYAPEQKKWFLTVEGATHPDESSNGRHVADWEYFDRALKEFLKKIADSKHSPALLR